MYYSSPFSEPPSPWLSQADVEGIAEGGTASTPTSVNRQSTMKMEADEALGNAATISSVLYANVNHPEWKSEFPGKFIPGWASQLAAHGVQSCLWSLKFQFVPPILYIKLYRLCCGSGG